MDMTKRARGIADFMVDYGTQHTTTGNMHFDYEEINKMFGVNLPEDDRMLSEIENEVWLHHAEKIAELELSEDFDFLFWLDFCPMAEEG